MRPTALAYCAYSRRFLAAPLTIFTMHHLAQLNQLQTASLFTKPVKHMGRPTPSLLDHPRQPHVFRVYNDRVYYVPESMANLPQPPTGANPAVGTCLGQFTYGH